MGELVHLNVIRERRAAAGRVALAKARSAGHPSAATAPGQYVHVGRGRLSHVLRDNGVTHCGLGGPFTAAAREAAPCLRCP